MTEPLSRAELAEWKTLALLSSAPEPGRLVATIDALQAEIRMLRHEPLSTEELAKLVAPNRVLSSLEMRLLATIVGDHSRLAEFSAEVERLRVDPDEEAE